jgi:hypothetical protein
MIRRLESIQASVSVEAKDTRGRAKASKTPKAWGSGEDPLGPERFSERPRVDGATEYRRNANLIEDDLSDGKYNGLNT